MHTILLCPFVWVTVKFCTSGRFIGNYKSDQWQVHRHIYWQINEPDLHVGFWCCSDRLCFNDHALLRHKDPTSSVSKGNIGVSLCLFAFEDFSREGGELGWFDCESPWWGRNHFFPSFAVICLSRRPNVCKPQPHNFIRWNFICSLPIICKKFNNSSLTKNEHKQNHIPARSETTWILLLM